MMTSDQQVATFGFRISTRGDAVPGGYNGTLFAFDPETGQQMGRLDYRSALDYREADIAMIEVADLFRGRGVATNLFQAARAELADYAWSYGMLTDDGAAWLKRLPAELQRDRIPPLDGDRYQR